MNACSTWLAAGLSVSAMIAACASDPAQPAAPEASSGAESAQATAVSQLAPSEQPPPVATSPEASPPAPPEPQPSAATPARSVAVTPAQAPARPSQPPAKPAPMPAQPAASAPATSPQPSAAATKPATGTPLAANGAGRVVIELTKLESDAGKIQAALFRSAAGFPDDPARAAVRKTVKSHAKRVDLAFDNVPPGVFAVLVHHDENGDAKMQTGMFGIPAEGYGISRDAPASFGPPSYEDARLTLAPGETKRIVIKMRY